MKKRSSGSRAKKPFYRDLFFQVITAIVLGVLLGYLKPDWAVQMKPLGEGFINLIKMMIAPIIFCTMVTGIAGIGDIKQVGRVGVKAIFYFEVITTLALIIGMVLVEIFKPGSTMNIDIASVDVSTIKDKVAHAGTALNVTDFFMNIIPTTMISAFTGNEILQVLLVAILFATGLLALGPKGHDIMVMIDSFSHVLFKMVDFITRLAPIGAFGAMAYSVGKFGVASLGQLGALVGIFYLTCFLFILLVLVPVMRFYCGLSTLQFLRYIKEELTIVLGTASSESVFPRIMEKLTAMGCSKSVVGLVIPAGYSFNLVGSSIYFTMGALFITYATHTPITFWQELLLLGILLLTSKGAAGVSGSAFLVLAATLTSMHLIPQQNLEVGLALIFAIDRFMSTGRAIVNLIGNGMATIMLAKWEGKLDEKLARDVLARRRAPQMDAMEH